MTAIHLIKETPQYYISIDTWSSCCSPYKKKKKYADLQVNYPMATDEDVINFLDKKAWHEWVNECLSGSKSKHKDTEMHEAIEMLDKIFPHHEKVYFHELRSIIAAYNHGTFLSYDYRTKELEEPTEHEIKRRKYFTGKYKGFFSDEDIQLPDNVVKLREKYWKLSKKGARDEKQTKAFRAWKDAEEDYLYENHDLTDMFVRMCKKAIVLPMAFSSPSVEGSAYEHAGELYLIITPNKIYFEIERHY
jgi:hypothetical protein